MASIQGKTIVFTGKLEQMTRSEAEAQAKKLGAKIGRGVNKDTDILVAGRDAGSKLEDAKKQRVKVIDEAAWVKMLGRPGVSDEAEPTDTKASRASPNYARLLQAGHEYTLENYLRDPNAPDDRGFPILSLGAAPLRSSEEYGRYVKGFWWEPGKKKQRAAALAFLKKNKKQFDVLFKALGRQTLPKSGQLTIWGRGLVVEYVEIDESIFKKLRKGVPSDEQQEIWESSPGDGVFGPQFQLTIELAGVLVNNDNIKRSTERIILCEKGRYYWFRENDVKAEFGTADVSNFDVKKLTLVTKQYVLPDRSSLDVFGLKYPGVSFYYDGSFDGKGMDSYLFNKDGKRFEFEMD